MQIKRHSSISKHELFLHNQINDEEFAKQLQDPTYLYHNVKKFSKKNQERYKYIDHNGDEQQIYGFHHLLLHPKSNTILVFLWDLRIVVGYIKDFDEKHLLAKNYDPRTPLVCLEQSIVNKLNQTLQ